MIEAAGGVIWRNSDSAEMEVLLIHRPRHDDWSLPKGKLRPGESARRGALREVKEETGIRCDLGPELAEVRYRDRNGRDKRVRYWAMQGISGRFKPNREVDGVRWVGLAEAARLLSYDHDLPVLAALSELLVAAS